jgi:phosphoribosylanthranilate isomerase
MTRTRVKVCGICTADDADAAVSAGADAIGMVFYPKSPRHVSISAAREIASSIPPFVTTVGLFVNSSSEAINDVLSEVQLGLLQFHGNEDEVFCKSFNLPYIKALRVKAETDLYQQCEQYASARGVLLDSYKKGMPGGTGEIFDWDVIPDDLSLPVILAGGLNANNVAQAISTVNPWAVDVSSGVEESPGKKDQQKILQFFNAVEHLCQN